MSIQRSLKALQSPWQRSGFLLMPLYGSLLTVKAAIFLATTIHKYSYIGR